MSVADSNRTILTGENPFIRLSAKDGDPNSTDASFWRIIFCPAGPGQVLNPELKDLAIPVTDAAFDKSGDTRDFWTEHVSATDAEIALTWHEIGEPLLIHTQPNQPP